MWTEIFGRPQQVLAHKSAWASKKNEHTIRDPSRGRPSKRHRAICELTVMCFLLVKQPAIGAPTPWLYCRAFITANKQETCNLQISSNLSRIWHFLRLAPATVAVDTTSSKRSTSQRRRRSHYVSSRWKQNFRSCLKQRSVIKKCVPKKY